MKKIPRFALREEYFGGLLLDYDKKKYHLLSSKEFRIMDRLLSRGRLNIEQFKNQKNIKLLKTLEKNNIVATDGSSIVLNEPIRKIEVKKIPPNYLSCPIKVYDTYTRRCNLACRHCYASSSPINKEKRRNKKTCRKKDYRA